MEEIELRAFVRMIRDQKRLILGVMALCLLVSGLITFWVLPRQYKATATLLYSDTSSLGSAGALAATLGFPGLSSTNGPAPWFEIILTSRTLARKMVKKYNLVKVLKADNELEAIDKFLEVVSVTAKPEAKSFQLAVQIPGSLMKYPGNRQDKVRAKLAADIVNDMVAFLDTWLKTEDYRKSTIERKFVENQLQQVLTEINRLRAALLGTFRSGVFAPDEQAQAWLSALGAVEEEVATTKAQLSASRLAAQAGASADERRRLAGAADLDQKAGGVAAGLRKQINDLEVQLRHELEVNHKTVDHPDVAQLKAAIRELKTKLNTELAIISEARNLEESRLSTQLGQGVGRWSKLQAQISALPARGLEVTELKRKLESGADLVDMLTKQLVLARIAEAQETEHFDVLDAAEPPRKQVSPSMPIGLAVGIAAGLILGLMAGGLRQFLQKALA